MIDWNMMSAEEIVALVKACNPWNKGAGTRWKGWTFGITYATIANNGHFAYADPGTILSIDTTAGMVIACREGKAIRAEIIYCEEGFYPGHYMSAFGLHRNERLV
jgi:methionyl-tRNA formyltransferase